MRVAASARVKMKSVAASEVLDPGLMRRRLSSGN